MYQVKIKYHAGHHSITRVPTLKEALGLASDGLNDSSVLYVKVSTPK